MKIEIVNVTLLDDYWVAQQIHVWNLMLLDFCNIDPMQV